MNGFMHWMAGSAVGAALWLATGVAGASTPGCARQVPRTIPASLMTDGFLDGHPDLRWRRYGLKEFDKGNLPRALSRFRKAAEYADKYSQLRVAIMYREGSGVPADPELAYAWMDLAAERGYHDFVRLRDAWWAELDAGQRERALQRRQDVFAQYGDQVAKPRLESAMRGRLSKITGSRVGHVHSGLQVVQHTGATAGEVQSGADYYDPEYWKPELYWCLHDTYWMAPLRQQQIDVGRPETVHGGEGDGT